MTRVFISYSRQDKTIADDIAAELRRRGAEVFIDYQRLVGGEDFTDRLGGEIEKCDFLVLLLSPRSVTSKWVKAEATYAHQNNKRIVPVLLEPTKLTGFFFLSAIEQVDLTARSRGRLPAEALRKLAVALNLSPDPAAASPPPPVAPPVPPHRLKLPACPNGFGPPGERCCC